MLNTKVTQHIKKNNPQGTGSLFSPQDYSFLACSKLAKVSYSYRSRWQTILTLMTPVEIKANLTINKIQQPEGEMISTVPAITSCSKQCPDIAQICWNKPMYNVRTHNKIRGIERHSKHGGCTEP